MFRKLALFALTLGSIELAASSLSPFKGLRQRWCCTTTSSNNRTDWVNNTWAKRQEKALAHQLSRAKATQNVQKLTADRLKGQLLQEGLTEAEACQATTLGGLVNNPEYLERYLAILKQQQKNAYGVVDIDPTDVDLSLECCYSAVFNEQRKNPDAPLYFRRDFILSQDDKCAIDVQVDGRRAARGEPDRPLNFELPRDLGDAHLRAVLRCSCRADVQKLHEKWQRAMSFSNRLLYARFQGIKALQKELASDVALQKQREEMLRQCELAGN